MIDYDHLRKILHYNKNTGRWTWLKRSKTGKAQPGKIAGDGKFVGIDGKNYRASRLAVLYMTGEWPSSWIDHKNGDRKDNRWSNLRPATPSQNQWNRKRPKNNTTGYVGVRFHYGVFEASIQVERKRIYLGSFKTAKAAYAARMTAAHELHGIFANDG